MHCFHDQQILEMLLTYLLEQLMEQTAFKTDKTKYFMALQVISVDAEEYRYNFLLECSNYLISMEIANELLNQLLGFTPRLGN